MTKKIENLQVLLASTYTLYLKTQNYHWNVTGINFYSLHKLFEEQYNDLFMAVDAIAEKIRAHGEKAYGTFTKYLKISVIKEAKDEISDKEMVKDLLNDQKIMIDLLNKLIKEFAGDEATIDMLIGRVEVHEKNSWMLKSILA